MILHKVNPAYSLKKNLTLTPGNISVFIRELEGILKSHSSQEAFSISISKFDGHGGSPAENKTQFLNEILQELQIQDEWLVKLSETIIKELSSPIFSVDHLAELSGIGARQLRRKVKKLYLASPHDLINDVRYSMARLLIASNPDISFENLKSQLGIQKRSYFLLKYEVRYGNKPNLKS